MNIPRIAAMLMLILTLTGCEDKGTNTAQIERPLINGVQTVKVSLVQLPVFYETVGTVKAKATVTIASRLMGEITQIMFREGDIVKAGQLLVSIDDRQLRQQINAAEAALNAAQNGLATADEQRRLAELTYQRYKHLFDENAISGQEIDEIKTKMRVARLQYKMAGKTVTQAEASLAQARIAHGFASVHAPISGMIIKKMIDVGNMAAPGLPLLTLEMKAPFHLDVEVDENKAKLLHEHLAVEVEIPSQGRRISGLVTNIVKAVDPQSHSLLVKIGLKAQGLNSGMFARVYVPDGSQQTLVIPPAAIVSRGQLTGVYAVDALNQVTFRLIRTGKTSAAGVEVLSGLKENERVIDQGTERAIDGGIIGTERQS